MIEQYLNEELVLNGELTPRGYDLYLLEICILDEEGNEAIIEVEDYK